MDKANVRILFLALIAVMFIGQIVYDFVKKHRSQAHRRRPSPRPMLSVPTPQNVSKASISPSPLSTKSSPSSLIATSDSTDPLAQPEPKPDPASESASMSESPQSDELRRAIIWSEILKRKF